MIDPSFCAYVVQLLEIAQGLQYLHTHKPSAIFHGDLKGVGRVFLVMVLLGIISRQYNVLISQEGHALLADFGFSRVVNSSFTMSNSPSGGGTLRWMAPEILESGEPTAPGDVWAFGMTCLVSGPKSIHRSSNGYNFVFTGVVYPQGPVFSVSG